MSSKYIAKNIHANIIQYMHIKQSNNNNRLYLSGPTSNQMKLQKQRSYNNENKVHVSAAKKKKKKIITLYKPLCNLWLDHILTKHMYKHSYILGLNLKHYLFDCSILIFSYSPYTQNHVFPHQKNILCCGKVIMRLKLWSTKLWVFLTWALCY